MPSQDEIDKVTKAGTAAPTGMGMQSPYIVVVKNKALRDELSKMNAEVLGTHADPFYNAPVIIVVLASKSRNTYMNDGSLVMGNMLNAAHAIGLGACWIHRAKEVFESERGKQLLNEWGLYDSAAPLPAASFSACLRSQLGRAKALMASSPGMSIGSVSGSTHSPTQSHCARPVSKRASLHAPGTSFSSHRRIFHAPRTRESATAGVSACMALLCTLPLCHTVLLLAVTSIS